jgi:serine/threonine protein kinase
MKIPLVYLPKKKGGRLTHVNTFIHSNSQKDAEWTMNDTLQLENTPMVIKMMDKLNPLSNHEMKAFDYFHSQPHPNIIQMICFFTCKDSPIRWVKRLSAPQSFCKADEKTTMVIIIQDYIQHGDLDKNIHQLTLPQWKSVVSQLSYACIQFYEIGFNYTDWNSGNILIDTTTNETITYRIGRTNQTIQTNGVCPVLTDFGHSYWFVKDKQSISNLTDMLSFVWYLIAFVIPNAEWKKRLETELKTIIKIKTLTGILRATHSLLEDLRTTQ